MNCHRARQLISPYLDHELTGRQMLDLQRHCAECVSCDAEMRSLRQLKSLLRSLHEPRTAADLPIAIAGRLREAEAPFALGNYILPLFARPLWLFPVRPQRGRRLTAALALSCLTVFTIAAPFAPASHDGAMAAVMLFRAPVDPPAQPGVMQLTSMPPVDVRPSEFLGLTETDESQRERMFAAPYVQTAQPDGMTSPLMDDPVPAYVQGDVAFASYRTR